LLNLAGFRYYLSALHTAWEMLDAKRAARREAAVPAVCSMPCWALCYCIDEESSYNLWQRGEIRHFQLPGGIKVMARHASEKAGSQLSLWISITSAFIAIISAVVAYLSYAQPGVVQPITPGGYAIVRGDGSFPSDMIVLPLEWQNTRGKPVLIRHPELFLHELDANGKETGTIYRFVLAGEFPEISYSAIAKGYVFESSFVVPANSIPIKNLVFHYERWWDETNRLYDFRFKGGQKYKVTIRYQPNQETIREQELLTLPIYNRVDELGSDRSKSYWDYWYIDTK
jgi:hypothetical protein